MQINFGDICYRKRFEKKILIENGTLELSGCGICILTGPNGSGKTMLLKYLFHKLQKYDVCYINQHNRMVLSGKRVNANIAMSEKQDDLELVNHFLEENDLKYLLDVECKVASGGERRMIAICRAIMSHAQYILIDEPTNDLDRTNTEILLNIMKKYSQESCFVVISHDQRIREIGDDIYCIQDHKLIHCDSKCNAEIKREIEGRKSHIDEHTRCFCKRCLPKQWLFYLVPLLLMIVTIWGTRQYLNSPNYLPERTYDKQIDILSPLSNKCVQVCVQGGVFIADGKLFANEIKIQDIERISETIKNERLMPATYGLHLQNTTYYKVYTMEYIDRETKIHYDTLEDCIEKGYQLSSTEYHIDLEGVMDYPSYLGQAIEFDEQKFREAEARIKTYGGSIEPLHQLIILGPNMDFETFMNDDAMADIMLGNYYIQSAETISGTNAVLKYRYIKQLSSVIFVSYLFAILMALFMAWLYFQVMKNKICIFRDYGMREKEILAIVKNKQCTVLEVLIFLAMLFFVGTYTIQNSGNVSANHFEYIMILIGCVVLTIAYMFAQVILTAKVHALYTWRDRN